MHDLEYDYDFCFADLHLNQDLKEISAAEVKDRGWCFPKGGQKCTLHQATGNAKNTLSFYLVDENAASRPIANLSFVGSSKAPESEKRRGPQLVYRRVAGDARGRAGFLHFEKDGLHVRLDACVYVLQYDNKTKEKKLHVQRDLLTDVPVTAWFRRDDQAPVICSLIKWSFADHTTMLDFCLQPAVAAAPAGAAAAGGAVAAAADPASAAEAQKQAAWGAFPHFFDESRFSKAEQHRAAELLEACKALGMCQSETAAPHGHAEFSWQRALLAVRACTLVVSELSCAELRPAVCSVIEAVLPPSCVHRSAQSAARRRTWPASPSWPSSWNATSCSRPPTPRPPSIS